MAAAICSFNLSETAYCSIRAVSAAGAGACGVSDTPELCKQTSVFSSSRERARVARKNTAPPTMVGKSKTASFFTQSGAVCV